MKETQFTCEQNVKKIVETEPGVKLLLRAIRGAGCEIKLDEYFSCEPCDQEIRGGFDSINNQIFLCHERTYKYKDCAEIMTHELVHAFDQCRASLDSSNVYNIACTEIRAANLTLIYQDNQTAYDLFDSNLVDRKSLVRDGAARSLQAVKNMSRRDALRIVDKVFDECYNDLEPFGRRIESISDYKRAYDQHKYKDFATTRKSFPKY